MTKQVFQHFSLQINNWNTNERKSLLIVLTNEGILQYKIRYCGYAIWLDIGLDKKIFNLCIHCLDQNLYKTMKECVLEQIPQQMNREIV